MSADNWAICPKCKAEKRLIDMRVLNPKEYPKTTLREDYEQGMSEDGSYSCSYRCHCSECGFHWEFNHSDQAFRK